MAKTLAHHLTDLRLDLKDGSTLWSDAELTRCIEKAVADFTRFSPRKMRTELVVNTDVTSESFTTPATSDTDYFIDNYDLESKVDGQVATAAASRPDVPRPVIVTVTDADTSITQLHIIIKGYDADNKYVEESFWLEGGLVQTGVEYFSLVTEVEIDEITGNGASDALDVGTGSHLGVWVQLSCRSIRFQSEVITGLTRDTDYEMDYTQGRVCVKSGGSAVAGTSYTLAKYTKRRIDIDISSIRGALIRIDKIEYPVGNVPQTFARFDEPWGDTVTFIGDAESQYEMADAQHCAVYYYAQHAPPNAQSSGSYPEFLETSIDLAASAYALFMKALQYEHQAVTDLASVRTELGLTTDIHTAIATALTAVKKYLDNNSNADAVGLLQDITDTVSELRTKVVTAWNAAATELGLVGTNSLDKATTGAEAYLDTGDGLINQLNDGGPNVPEKYSDYSKTRNAIGQTRIMKAQTYLKEAESRLSDIVMYVQQSTGHKAVSEVFVLEAQARLTEMEGFLAEAQQYENTATITLQLADRWKAEGIERRNEAWAIWKDSPQYAPAYTLTQRSQTAR